MNILDPIFYRTFFYDFRSVISPGVVTSFSADTMKQNLNWDLVSTWQFRTTSPTFLTVFRQNPPGPHGCWDFDSWHRQVEMHGQWNCGIQLNKYPLTLFFYVAKWNETKRNEINFKVRESESPSPSSSVLHIAKIWQLHYIYSVPNSWAFWNRYTYRILSMQL
jgi:hypothetical protein